MITPETELERVNAVNWREQKDPRQRKPRILLVSNPYAPRQQQHFADYHKADMRFWGKAGENSQRLAALAKGADFVIVWHGVPHSITQSLKGRGITFQIMPKGGPEQVRALLDLAVEQFHKEHGNDD